MSEDAARTPAATHRLGQITESGEWLTAHADAHPLIAWSGPIDRIDAVGEPLGEPVRLALGMSGHCPDGGTLHMPNVRAQLTAGHARELYDGLGAALGLPADAPGQLRDALTLLRDLLGMVAVAPPAGRRPRYYVANLHDPAITAEVMMLWCAACPLDPAMPLARVEPDYRTQVHLDMLNRAIARHDRQAHPGDPAATHLAYTLPASQRPENASTGRAAHLLAALGPADNDE